MKKWTNRVFSNSGIGKTYPTVSKISLKIQSLKYVNNEEDQMAMKEKVKRKRKGTRKIEWRIEYKIINCLLLTKSTVVLQG